MTKTHCTQGSAKSQDLMVYQCEICGHFDASIAPLKAHKNQYHPKHDMGMQCKLVCFYIF